MTPSTTQTRQMVYGLAILVLFVVMFPYTAWLREQKRRKDLGEATIGQIDTGSFLVKLALLGGARGIAANWFWMRAIELQKVHEWDKLETTVNVITKLQPHFLMVWTWQGWNLAYNVSVEWDAPEDKYEWIKKGTKFLQEGVQKNRKSPDLVWDTAWNYYNKIGFSDETIILRRLFHDDTDVKFKTVPGDGNSYNDNYLVAHGWFRNSMQLADRGNARLTTAIEYVDKPTQHKGRPGDLNFRSMPAHALTRYADRLEMASILGIPATFGEIARIEWDRAHQAWTEFGNHDFPMHNREEVPIHLIDVFYPTVYHNLPEDQQFWTDRWAGMTNFKYWYDKSAVEKTAAAVNARRLFYEGNKAYKAADFPKAVRCFREGLAIWQEALKDHPYFRDDELNQHDTGVLVKHYKQALIQAGEEVPQEMPFPDLLSAAEASEELPDPFSALDMIPDYHEDAPAAP